MSKEGEQLMEVRCPRCHRLLCRSEGNIEVEMVCFKCKSLWSIRMNDSNDQGGADFRLLKEGKARGKAMGKWLI